MSTYIHFTDAQKEQARQTDLVSLLKSQGEILKRSGKEFEWRDGSQKVTIRGNLWFHQYERKGGDAIDFVRRFMGKTYPEAMEYLLGGCGGTLITSPQIIKECKPFELPPQNDNMRRVYAYLTVTRKIDSEVLKSFADRNMIYESADYHNAVFVGYDTDGVPRHAHKRGTGQTSTFKGNVDSCIPEYSFHWNGISDRLYLFEAPIDMLSFISMNKDGWQNHSYATCCGVSDRVMWQMIGDNPNIHTVYLCLDNDDAGHIANKRISDKLSEKGIQTQILIPINKDWNEDLTLLSGEREVEEPCPALVL
ncbi:MAG: DUF3991 domain-containing protein [Clostridiales bacterium]|nr:DUF3991 domain-containing protein [Clostridiales bacterium]